MRLRPVFAALALLAAVTLPARHEVTPEAPVRAAEVLPAPTGHNSRDELVVALHRAAEAQAAASAWYEAASRPPPAPPTRPEPRAPRSSSAPHRTSYAGSAVVFDAIQQAFGGLADQATNVAYCESTLDPSAVSKGGGNYGLFQINYVHADDFQAVTGQPFHDGALDPYANAAYAKHLYDESGGWGPWACRWAA